MGNSHHYRSVSGDESAPLAEKEAKFSPGRSGWGKMSIIMTIVVGGLVLTILAGVATTIGSVAANYTQNEAASTTAAAAVVTTSAAAEAQNAPTTTIAADTPASTGSDPSLQTDHEIEHCGYSPQEARERGCVFDVMMQLWTPKACFDEVLSDRFLEVGNWTWYADPGAEKAFTLEEMRLGEHDAVYVAQDYHKTHCIYAWEKLVRAMRNQEPLIMELISYDHVIHCRHKTLQRADDAVRGVRAPTGYTMCAPFGTWIHHLPANEHSTID